MSDATAAGAPTEPTKKKTEVTMVKMEDGRDVGFAGKRKLVKESLFDEKKILIDGNTVTLELGAVTTRLNFRNGRVINYVTPIGLVAKEAAHGAEQKLGDETAGEEKVEDMVLSCESLVERLNKLEWNVPSEAGGFSGASIVIKAICEASGKSVEEVKKFLQKKLDDAVARKEKLSRADLYGSFRNPNSKIGQIVERMEREERAKNSKVDADAALGELGVATPA